MWCDRGDGTSKDIGQDQRTCTQLNGMEAKLGHMDQTYTLRVPALSGQPALELGIAPHEFPIALLQRQHPKSGLGNPCLLGLQLRRDHVLVAVTRLVLALDRSHGA